jgi:3-oxoacyl-[acyl-carrier protein] reductase
MTRSSRVAIVTGSSKGIGAAIALRLARSGPVVVNYVSDKSAADRVVAQIESSGGRAIAVRADVSAPDAMPALFDAAEHTLGQVDVLVNNAAIMMLGPLTDVDDASFSAQVEANLGGTFRGMREAGRRLRDGGRIINLSTSVVGTNLPGYGIYTATKAAVEAMTRIAAKELAPRGITVNAVAPGPIETELFFAGKSEAQVEAITRMIPLGRLGRPDEIAAVVEFLASPDGGWVNGQTVRTNGGMV